MPKSVEISMDCDGLGYVQPLVVSSSSKYCRARAKGSSCLFITYIAWFTRRHWALIYTRYGPLLYNTSAESSE
jgi:hypothetical protein